MGGLFYIQTLDADLQVRPCIRNFEISDVFLDFPQILRFFLRR